jgi:DNA polymerase-3 subunit epsilon
MNFVAIDFETANEKRWSPCEVSISKVIDGSIADTFTALIKPHPTASFNTWNTQIHGIKAADVSQSPEFPAVFSEMFAFIGDLPFVAHSAGFDMGVLSQTASLYSLDVPEIPFYCTRVLAKQSRNLDLPSYSLANVCDALDVPFQEQHRAESDAVACARVALALVDLEGVSSISELSQRLLVRPGVLSGAAFSGTRSHRTRFSSSMGKGAAADFLNSISEDDIQFDDDFRGKEVIFTGALSSMERKTAQEKVLLAGGTTGNNVTRKTSIVVVGTPYDSELRPGAEISGKLRKVLDLRASGADIELLTESEFLQLFEN